MKKEIIKKKLNKSSKRKEKMITVTITFDKYGEGIIKISNS